MAERTHITPEMLRAALSELLLVSAPFMRSHGHKRTPAQDKLLVTVDRTRALLKLPAHGTSVPLDPDQLLQAYIHQGGDWRALIAAINRNATDAIVQRYQQSKEASHEQKKTN